MKNNSDTFSDDGVAQRLNFTTPEKRFNDWRMPPVAEEYARRLFESNKKIGEVSKNIILVMPLFDEQRLPSSPENIIASIHSLLA